MTVVAVCRVASRESVLPRKPDATAENLKLIRQYVSCCNNGSRDERGYDKEVIDDENNITLGNGFNVSLRKSDKANIFRNSVYQQNDWQPHKRKC